jgi:hypothetical protein
VAEGVGVRESEDPVDGVREGVTERDAGPEDDGEMVGEVV